MSPLRKAYLQLHTSVFLWGFTAILGKLISLQAIPLVWFRIFLTCISLLFLPKLLPEVRKIKRADLLMLCGIGCLVALHWICFYASIKFSNVSVALSCLATSSFITAFIEPLMRRHKPKLYEMLLGVLIVPGIYLIFYFTGNYQTGIVLGLVAAFLSATFTVLNKIVVDKHEPRSMTFVELSSGLVFLSILLPFYIWFFPDTLLLPTGNDWLYLLFLAVGCTTLPFVLALRSLQQLSAFTSTLTVNLEPIYGIIMAIIFFNEDKDLNTRFYIGTFIILLAVFVHPLLKKIFEKEPEKA